ncbi:unnamed protein product [Sphagnum troendelagicum]|uniref:Uncharacterized protein n=1 Tax=Sphagnum troendelagicum TaxID=128251 RepID=A0ABP0TXV0_9BRYO
MDEHRETLPSSKCSRTPQPIAQRCNEAAADEDHQGSGAAGKNNLLKEGGRGERLYGVKKGRCIRQWCSSSASVRADR